MRCSPRGAAERLAAALLRGLVLEDAARTHLVDTAGEGGASGSTCSRLACVVDEMGAPASTVA